jgi:hypothetical protein
LINFSAEANAKSKKVVTKPGEDISKISEKIRSEYINAIEALQTNLENLKLKYQHEVAGRKDDYSVHKEETRDLKRKIKILEEEVLLLNNKRGSSENGLNFQEEALAEKSMRIQLEEEKDLLQTILASTKAAWAECEMEKERIQHKYSRKKEEVNLYGERIAELELQVVRGKQDLLDTMNSIQGYDNLM